MKNTEQNLIIENEAETEVTLADVGSIADAVSSTSINAEVLRIQEDVPASWKGVNGCDHSDTIQANIKSAIDNWAKDQIFRHSDLRWLRYGSAVPTLRVHTTFYKDWDGTRSCLSRVGIPCFIEFQQ